MSLKCCCLARDHSWRSCGTYHQRTPVDEREHDGDLKVSVGAGGLWGTLSSSRYLERDVTSAWALGFAPGFSLQDLDSVEKREREGEEGQVEDNEKRWRSHGQFQDPPRHSI